MFLARVTQQQDKILHENIVNQLETDFMITQEEQDYGMDEGINFLDEDDAEEQPDIQNMRILCKEISETTDVKPYGCNIHQ